MAEKVIDKETLINTIGEFGWSFGQEFFIETKFGNFVWSDPDYNGDNTIKKFDGDLKKFCRTIGISFVRDKGKHLIGKYCGTNFTLIQ